MSIDGVVVRVKSEYPELADESLTVERQFTAGLGWLSNTWLIRSDCRPQFVAKARSTTSQISKLSTEWWALRTLMDQAADLAPGLIFPEHEPRDILLIEYLDGITGDEALRAGADANAVYERTGQALARLHAIKLPAFGVPESPIDDWAAYVSHKLDERFRGSRRSIDAALASRVDGRMRQLRPALERE